MSFLSAPIPRPRIVNLSLIVTLSASLLGFVNFFFYLPALMAHLKAQGLPAEALSSGMMIGGGIFGVALTGVACFFIARGSNTARWIWACFSIYGVLSALSNIRMAISVSPVLGPLGITITLVSTACVVMLFLPEASAWFRAIKQTTKPTT